jgi:hypothetical protein
VPFERGRNNETNSRVVAWDWDGFLPQGNITVNISKSPPGRYLYIGIQQ